jgi:ABC-2 type transport system permease protein
MSDLGTMIWKEVRDQVLQGGRQAWIRPLLIIGIMGIFLPWKEGPLWLTSNPGLVPFTVCSSFFFISSFIGDAFAGERERHTLETLLASRISDQAILLGKVIVTVGYTFLLVLVGLLLGALVANLKSAPGARAFYTPFSLLSYTLILSLLSSLLAASGGTLISLHSSTVRQAQQTLVLASLGLAFVLVVWFRSEPANVLASLNNNQLLLLILASLTILDVFLLAIAMASFKRSRLILS